MDDLAWIALRAAAWAIVILLPLNWVAALLLWAAHLRLRSSITLRDRAQAAGLITVGLTLLSVAALNVGVQLGIDPPWPALLVSAGLIVISVINVLWLFRYLTGSLEKEEGGDQ